MGHPERACLTCCGQATCRRGPGACRQTLHGCHREHLCPMRQFPYPTYSASKAFVAQVKYVFLNNSLLR